MSLRCHSGEVFLTGRHAVYSVGAATIGGRRMGNSERTGEDARYLSVHLARFDEVGLLPDHDDVAPAGSPSSWLIGADEGRHGSEFASQLATEFIAVGVHADEASARACAAAEVAPFAGATEVWSAALLPVKSHGCCNWIGDDGHFAVARDRQPIGDVVITLTTAGWDLGADFDVQRAMSFGAGVERVRTWIRDEPIDGMRASHNFTYPGMLVHDGSTFSIWRDDAAMKEFAYRPGAHKTEMDAFRIDETADRTSWTRLHPLESHGTWSGTDPLKPEV